VLPLPKASPCQTRMEIEFAGMPVILDAGGALFLPELGALAVADLHFEKGSFFASRGNPLPCCDTRDTLARLAAVIGRYRPRRVICLGDSFHDQRAGERMRREDADHLAELMGSVEDWLWLTGNHDPEISRRFAGRVAPHLSVGDMTLCHRPEDGLMPLIAGHYHPKHSVRLAGRHISARCFVLGEGLLLMPAFGAYTGGLRTVDAAIGHLFDPAPQSYFMLYREKLWAMRHTGTSRRRSLERF
jgi:uncharacterized protein